MKISTLNKIEKWYWAFWRVFTIGLSIIFIIFLIIQIKENQVVYKEVVESCDIDNAIDKFRKNREIEYISFYGWNYPEGKWSLRYEDTYEGEEVDIRKEFSNMGDVVNFLNSK